MTRTATFKGLLGVKLGMTQIFDENAQMCRSRSSGAGPNTVTQVKVAERGRLLDVRLAFGDVKPSRSQAAGRSLLKAGDKARRHLVELRTADAGEYSLGEARGRRVRPGRPGRRRRRVQGQGLRRRDEAARLQGPGRLPRRHRAQAPLARLGRRLRHPGAHLQGVRMAGHMGNQQVAVLNLGVVKADPNRNMLVRGAVPGPKRGLVMVRSSVKAVTG